MKSRLFARRTAPTLLSIAVLSAAFVLAGCGKGGADTKMGGAPVSEVSVITLQPQKLVVTSELAGRTAAWANADVRPQVGGIIEKRLFTEGSMIKAGQPLYAIAPATYQAGYDSAKAALAKAEAALSSAQAKASRSKELVIIDAVSKQNHEDTLIALRQAEADVAANKAAVQVASVNLNYTRVLAPISGRIGRSSVTQGALVTANQAVALATIEQTDPMYVDITQSSSEYLRIKHELESGKLKRSANDEASVHLILDDGSRYPLTGKLKVSDPTVDATTGTVTLRAVFPNPKQDLLPGMYVRALLDSGVAEQALVVPQQAISRDKKGNAIALVVGSDNKVEERTLTTGQTVGDSWLVTAGLKAGEKVIVEGLQKAKAGATVKTVEKVTAPAPAASATPVAAAK